MHLTRTQLRRMRRAIIALSALPWTLPCLAQGGLQGLPDHELLAVHGAGLDEATLGLMGAATSREREQERQKDHQKDHQKDRQKDRQDGPSRDAAQATAQNAWSAQSQHLVNTVSRQALQMETTMAWVGASSAARTATTGVSLIALAPTALATVSLPLMGLPTLPGRH